MEQQHTVEIVLTAVSSRPLKRIVDADDPNQEIIDPTKPRIDLDQEKKIKVINFIIAANKSIYAILRLPLAVKQI